MVQTSRTRDQLFEDWLSRAKTIWLTCRIQGHWWPDYEVLERGGRLGTRTGGYMLDMSCQRGCEVDRRAFLTTEFGIDRHGNAYKYPVGYQLPEQAGGGWSMTKARRARIRRELRDRARSGDVA